MLNRREGKAGSKILGVLSFLHYYSFPSLHEQYFLTLLRNPATSFFQ